jgi:hypothetical protein
MHTLIDYAGQIRDHLKTFDESLASLYGSYRELVDDEGDVQLLCDLDELLREKRDVSQEEFMEALGQIQLSKHDRNAIMCARESEVVNSKLQ